MKRKKVLKAREISEVLKYGKLLRGKFLNLYFTVDSEEKIAFLVNRRIQGVVQRNRIKRRIREVWRLTGEYTKRNVHICLVAKETTERAKFLQLCDDIKDLYNAIEKYI